MASPAAILSVLVQARGIEETNRKLRDIHNTSERTSKSTEKLEGRFSRLDSTVGDFNRTFTGAGNVMKLVKFPALIAGAGAATQAVGALGAGAVALGSALGPLAGLGAAAGVGLTAAAQGMSVFKLATAGIGDALKEQLNLHGKVGSAAAKSASTDASSAQAVKAAQEGVRQAKDGVRQATVAVSDAVRAQSDAAKDVARALGVERDAQIAVTQAVRDARRELVDMHESLKDAVLSEQSAAINLEEARNKLTEVTADSTATDLDKRKAALGVAEAENQLADSQRERGRLSKDVARADKDGIAGSKGVVSAEQAVKDAHQGVVDAQRQQSDAARATGEAKRALVDAERKVLQATEAVRDAQKAGAASANTAASAATNLSSKLSALPKPAQDFVRVLISLKPKLDALRSAAAAGLLPGAAKGLLAAATNFGVVKTVVGQTASAMGRLAERAGTLVGSSGFGKDLATVGRRNATIIERVGNAAITLVDAFRHVTIAAGPLTLWLAKLSEKGADWILAQAKAGRESGKLAAFLQRTRDVMTTLGRSAFALAAGLLNIGHAATPLGTDLLDKFEKLTEKFRAWTESASGQNQIAAYFRNAKGPLLEIFGLVGDISGALLRLSTGKGAGDLIAKMRTLVPIFEDVVKSTTAAFGPALIDALGNMLRLFGALAGASGPLVQMVRLIGGIAGALADLLGSNPQLRAMTTSFIGVYGAVKALSFVFGPVIAGAKALQVAFIGQAAATNITSVALLRQRVALIATGAVMYASAAATGVMAGATWALNGAIAVLTSPITLVIVAIAALAAGVIYAYKHSETFRKVVDAMWATIKTVAAWMITAGVAAFNAVATAVKVAWGVVKSVTTTVWNGLKAFLVPLWGLLQTLLTGYFTAYKTIVTTAWNAIKTVTTTVWDAIKTVATTAWELIKTAAGTAWEAIKFVILTPIRAARDAIGGKGGIWDQIDKVATTAWEGIKKAIKAGAGAILDVILWPFKQAVKGVAKFAKMILGVIDKIPGVSTKSAMGSIDNFVKGLAQGGTVSKSGVQALAQGGIVRKPIVMMGEEAPRHPEYVIPTNPAYRGRAQMLLGQAAGAIGLAKGGIYSQAEMEHLWLTARGASGQATIAGAVGMAESEGNSRALGSYVASAGGRAAGLWQILGQVVDVGKSLFDPMVNARNAVAKFEAAGKWDGPWISSRDRPVTGWKARLAGGGDAGAGTSIGEVINALNPMNFINKLPGLGDLPDWLKGTGKWVLNHVGDWIKDKINGINASGGAPDFGGTGNPPADMLRVARSIAGKNYAYSYGGGHNPSFAPSSDIRGTGAFGYDCSGLVSAILHAGGFLGSPVATDGLKGFGRPGSGKSVTIGVRGSTGLNAHTMIKLGSRYFESGSGHGAAEVGGWSGGFPIRRHPPGLAHGGIIGQGEPFVGSYANGGRVPADGLGYLHQGETVIPRGAGGPLVHIAHMEIREETDVARVARSLAWQLETGVA